MMMKEEKEKEEERWRPKTSMQHTHITLEWSAHVASSVTNGIRRDDPDFETINFTSAVTAADAHLCVCV